MRHLSLFSLVGLLLLGPLGPAYSASWFDDFGDGSITDGNPVNWTFNEIGASPGSYDATSGDLVLSAIGDPQPILPTAASDNNLVPSVDIVFTDTYARTQAITLPDDPETEARGNVGIVSRWDPATVTGYVALVDHGDQLEVLRIDGGAPTPLDVQNNIGINALTDVVIEFNIVGDELQVFLWDPADPRPSTPISTVNDSTYASGRAGLFFNEDSDGHVGIFRFATAQDSPFVGTIAGDFNQDGFVNAADYAVWRDGLDDGDFTAADFDVWRDNFGAPLDHTAAAPAVVPEPSTLALTVGVLAAGFCRIRAAC